MSYYFKCEGLTKPQIIKAAKMLAKREGLELEDDFESQVSEYQSEGQPFIVMIDERSEVSVYCDRWYNLTDRKELKVTFKLTVEQANKELEDNNLSLYFDQFKNLCDDGFRLLTPNAQKLVTSLINRLHS